MKNMKKLTAMLLTLVMSLALAVPCFAAEPPPEKAPRGEWRYEYDEDFIWKSAPYEAAGQPREGYVFHQSGSIYYTPSKGGNVTLSIGISLGSIVSVSASLGVATQSAGVGGTSVNVPADSENAYKLYVTYVYHVNPYRSYYRETKNDEWQLVTNSAMVELIQRQLSVERCGPAY